MRASSCLCVRDAAEHSGLRKPVENTSQKQQLLIWFHGCLHGFNVGSTEMRNFYIFSKDWRCFYFLELLAKQKDVSNSS